MKKTLDNDEMVEAWKGLLFASSRVVRGLEEDMMDLHGITMIWFDVLSRLSQSEEHRLRMNELEARSVFTRSGMTRLVDRIESAGLVRRTRSPEDRRGVYVEITQAGRDKIDAIWPDHVAAIERHFGRFIDHEDAALIRRATGKILEGGAASGD